MARYGKLGMAWGPTSCVVRRHDHQQWDVPPVVTGCKALSTSQRESGACGVKDKKSGKSVNKDWASGMAMFVGSVQKVPRKMEKVSRRSEM